MKRIRQLLLLLLVSFNVNAQLIINNTGIPFINNFKRSNFNGGTQTWSITQDNRGIMYFANNKGIIEFDGINWRTYPMENSSIVRKIFKSKDGNIYIGAFNEFGYIDSDSNGNFKYKSISKHISSNYKDFGEVWSILDTDDGILFQSFSNTFLYTDTTISVLEGRNLNYAYKINDRVFICDNDAGILEYNNNVVNALQWGETFSGKEIKSIELIKNNTLLIGTSFNGLFTYDGSKLSNFNCPASKFLKKNQLYTLIKLEENLFAAGTIKNGIIFFNKQGDIIRHINREVGLQNNSVLALYLDKDYNLWVALDNGIDMIKLNSPVSMLFTPDEYGTGYVSALKNNNLYFGTNHGLYYTSKDQIIESKNKAQLQPIDKTAGQVWNLQDIDNILLCGHHNGAFEIVNNKAYKISDLLGFWKFIKLDTPDNLILATTYTGLVLFKYDKTKTPSLNFIKHIKGFNESCREMEIDKDGNIWLSHPYKGIYKIELSDNFKAIKSMKYYNSALGLPSDYSNFIYKVDDEIISLSKGGVYKYNANTDRFEHNSNLTHAFGKGNVDRICKDNYNNLWYFQNNELGIIHSNFKGVYSSEKVPYNELKDGFIPEYEHVLSINNSSLIISYEYGFLHFDKSKTTTAPSNYKALIRNVSTTNGEIIYNGGSPQFDSQNGTSLILPNKKNSLCFSVSALSYSNTQKIKYSFWLEGYDKEWSEWNYLNIKEYKKLKGGNYILHAKALNHFNIESTETTFTFSIKKPWYFSALAISIYIIGLIAIGFIIFKFIKHNIDAEKENIRKQKEEELNRKEKEFRYEKVLNEKEIIRLRNENLLIENDKNKAQLENKSKELASIVMKISSTNDVINRTKNQLDKIHYNMIHEESKKQVNRLINFLESELEQAESWKQFEIHFDQVHENFLKLLRQKFPNLTSKDLKMAAYLRMNMSTKEIAQLFNLTNRGVETSRFRLRKKLNLEKEQNLTDFLMSLTEFKS